MSSGRHEAWMEEGSRFWRDLRLVIGGEYTSLAS